MPSVWRSPATSAHRLVDAGVAARGAARRRRARSSISVWPWPARPARPTTSPRIGEQLAPVRLRGRLARARGAPACASTPAPTVARPCAALATLPIAATRLSRVNSRRRPLGDHLAVAHDDDAVGGGEDLAEEMRDQDARAAARRRSGGRRREAGRRRTASSDEVGSSRMTSRTGVSVTVKARAISTIWRRAIGEVADDVARRRCHGRERSRRACRRSAARRGRASRSPRSAAWKTRAFSATVRLGQSDSSWNTQRMPWRCAAATS